MKKKIITAMILTIALCSCGKQSESTQTQAGTSAADTAVTTTVQETVTTAEAEAATAADTTAAEEKSTEADTTAASAEDSEAEAATDPVYHDLFAGLFYDDTNENNSMSIDKMGDTYQVHISKKANGNECTEWYFTGEFNGRQVLHYDNCVKSVTTAEGDGAVSSVKEYTDGTGYIAISEEGTKTGYIWSDDKENAGSGIFFKMS